MARIRWQRDPRITKLVDTWPGTLDAGPARTLGFPQDENFDAIVRAYVESRASGQLRRKPPDVSVGIEKLDVGRSVGRGHSPCSLASHRAAGAQTPRTVAFENVTVVPMTE